MVINLILDLKNAGHPSFVHLPDEAIHQKAAELPEDGVPPEVITVFSELDNAQDKLQPQKAATPCDGMQDLGAAGECFAAQRPRAAVAEGSANQDPNLVATAALQELQADLGARPTRAAGSQVQNLEIRTGNRLVDQFQPLYFAHRLLLLLPVRHRLSGCGQLRQTKPRPAKQPPRHP